MSEPKQYIPQPLDTGKTELSAGLLELTELLAKNAHEIWAASRLAEGWRYGVTRNDALKEHPCLVAYENLPDEEKKIDRDMAMGTLKAIISLGFKIDKAQV
jgi:ryanodine receptor 2